MKNLFPILIVALFCCASLIYFLTKSPAKGFFYLFSALINLTAIYMG